MTLVHILLNLTGAYLLVGLLFSLPFAARGVNRIDPHATQGSWGFRLLIIPGVMFLWPLLARRWLSGSTNPPEEKTAHKLAARRRTLS